MLCLLLVIYVGNQEWGLYKRRYLNLVRTTHCWKTIHQVLSKSKDCIYIYEINDFINPMPWYGISKWCMFIYLLLAFIVPNYYKYYQKGRSSPSVLIITTQILMKYINRLKPLFKYYQSRFKIVILIIIVISTIICHGMGFI
jgi:hypothetical protein